MGKREATSHCLTQAQTETFRDSRNDVTVNDFTWDDVTRDYMRRQAIVSLKHKLKASENPDMTLQWLTSPEMTTHENTRGNEPSSHSNTNWNLSRLLRSRSTTSISGDLAQTGASPVSWGKGVTLNPRPSTSPCLDFPHRVSKEEHNQISKKIVSSVLQSYHTELRRSRNPWWDNSVPIPRVITSN